MGLKRDNPLFELGSVRDHYLLLSFLSFDLLNIVPTHRRLNWEVADLWAHINRGNIGWYDAGGESQSIELLGSLKVHNGDSMADCGAVRED
jgi:hypothetical protein